MSTKTSIKRIALVAAAALAVAGFSAVPAQAASATTITQAAGTGDGGVGGIAGPANSLGVTITPTVAKTYVTITGGTISSTNGDSVTAVVAANGLSATLTGTKTITIQTPTAGSLVINVYDALTASTYSSTVSVTKTIAITAAGISGVYSAAKSSIFIAAGETSTAVAVDAVVSTAATAAADLDTLTAAATIQVSYKDGNGTAMPQESITATIISGPGTVATTRVTGGTAATSDSTTVLDSTSAGPGLINNTVNQYSVAAHSSAAGWANFVIFPNGQTGLSTVVIKVAGVEIGRKTLTFAGTVPTSVTATVKKNYILNSTSATIKTIAVTAADASGNAITGLGATITGAVATGSTVGAAFTCGIYDTTDKVYYCSVAASAAQAALTTDASEVYTITAATGVTTTAKVMFVSAAVSTLTIAGPTSANPGEKITYTLTAKNANGNPIPDAAYAGDAFTKAPSASASLVTTPFSGVAANESVTVTNGVATATSFAPFGGNLSITWTLNGTAGVASGTAGIGTASLAKTLSATTVVAETEIVVDATASLALDAANAATDAANNAYDEAQNATQAASDALAAVTALAKQVKTLIASVKALTAAVAKLKK